MEFKLNSNRDAKSVNNKYNTYGYLIIMKNKHGFTFCAVV